MKHFLLVTAKIIGGLAATFIGLCVIITIIALNYHPTNASSQADAHTSSYYATKGTVASRPTQTVAASTYRVVLSESGNGSQTSNRFSVSDDWDIKWAYDCSNFGYRGNFQVDVSGTPSGYEVGVNELGMSGSGTDHLHGGAGKRYIEVNSECSWTIKAYSE